MAADVACLPLVLFADVPSIQRWGEVSAAKWFGRGCSKFDFDVADVISVSELKTRKRMRHRRLGGVKLFSIKNETR